MGKVSSIRALGKVLGVSHQTAAEYVKRPDWPVPRRPPWSEDHIRIAQGFAATLRADRSGGGSHPTARPGATDPANAQRFDPVIAAQVDVLLKKERMLHEKTKREVLEGKYVLREHVDGALGGLGALMLQIFEELEMSLPSALAGMTAGQVEKHLVRVLDAARQRIADKAEVELVRVSDLVEHVRKRGRGRPGAGA